MGIMAMALVIFMTTVLLFFYNQLSFGSATACHWGSSPTPPDRPSQWSCVFVSRYLCIFFVETPAFIQQIAPDFPRRVTATTTWHVTCSLLPDKLKSGN